MFFLAFTGMRGVDSLAVALAIPYVVASGAPFPHRDLILFVTFGVIIVTLVGQGMMLPAVMRWLGLTHLGAAEREDEKQAELVARVAALNEVDRQLEKFIAERELPEDVAEHMRTRNRSRKQVLPKDLADALKQTRLTAGVKKELIDAERDYIFRLLRDGKITDEARRRIEYELDLEEASVANRTIDGGGWFSSAMPADGFYESLPIFRDFTQVMDPGLFAPLPDDWMVGVADVVQSTKAIAENRYKAVNMAGAAVIVAITNALGGPRFSVRVRRRRRELRGARRGCRGGAPGAGRDRDLGRRKTSTSRCASAWYRSPTSARRVSTSASPATRRRRTSRLRCSRAAASPGRTPP